jgi:hypothetical protein
LVDWSRVKKISVIKVIVEEAMQGMSEKLFRLGLPPLHWGDAVMLSETTILLAFREKMTNGETPELVSLLNGDHSMSLVAFVQNHFQGRSKKSLEGNLMSSYKMRLIDKLQLNHATATLVYKTTIPQVMQSVFEVFSKLNVNPPALAKIVNDGLPFYAPISSSL